MSSNNQSDYTPSHDIQKLFLYNFIWGALGLTLGIILNNVTSYLIEKNNIQNNYIQIMIQLAMCSILLAYIHTEHNYFGWSWQNITPGLFFVSFFFGAQFLMFERLNMLSYKPN